MNNLVITEGAMRTFVNQLGILEIAITDEGAMGIASRSRGTPRLANRYLKRVRDFAEVLGSGDITLSDARLALEKMEIDELGLDNIEAAKPKLYIASLGDRATVKALEITERLRGEGKYAECDIVGRSLKAQMKYANKIGAEYTLIIGDSEIESGKAQLRNMQTGEQQLVNIEEALLLVRG